MSDNNLNEGSATTPTMHHVDIILNRSRLIWSRNR